jgi:hypothetical protein
MAVNDVAQQYYAGMSGELGNAIGLNQIAGKRRFLLLGNNPSIDIATVPEDLWFTGGIYNFITAPVTLELVSTSASDVAGANIAIVLALLDANWNEVLLTVVPNGLTPVAISGTYRAVNGSQVVGTAAGAIRTNIGDIIIRDAGAGLVRSTIPTGTGQSKKSIFTVPLGHSLNINKFFTSVNRAVGATPTNVTLVLGVVSATGVYRTPFEYGVSSTSSSVIEVNPGALLGEKETLFVRVVNVSANAMNVTVACSGILNKL